MMNRTLQLIVTVGLLACCPALAGNPGYRDAPPDAGKRVNPEQGAAATKAGATLYQAHCASCHGVIGKGGSNIPALSQGAPQAAKDGEIFWFISKGNVDNGMPAWTILPERDRWRLVAFIKTMPGLTAPPVSSASDAPAILDAPPPLPPFTDFRYEAPGNRRRLTVADLPAPYDTPSAGNGPKIVARPKDAWPKAPDGFKVELYASGLTGPRIIRTAPNGDIFVAESQLGRIRVLRGTGAGGAALSSEIFAEGLNRPFGLAFYPAGAEPKWLYVGDGDAILRFPYRSGDLIARGAPQKLAELPCCKGHWTRNLEFSADGKALFASVGSESNVADPDVTPSETNRATVLQFDPDGKGEKIYGGGLRNCVGLAIQPKTGQLWCSVNERDGLGDNLVPDYITHVEPGGFYGWPWYYLGGNQDPRHAGKHPELHDKVTVPDVLLQPHNASLGITFYQASQFPAAYRGDLFAAEHGSWNRAVRVGYEVIRVPMDAQGHATGDYEDFLTGFVVDNQTVWGRPVGVTVAADGSLLVSDDASGSIWRVSYVGK